MLTGFRIIVMLVRTSQSRGCYPDYHSLCGDEIVFLDIGVISPF